MQEILYRKCIFRAYLCWHQLPCMPVSEPQDFSRIQKVEILIDLPSQARAYDTTVRKSSHYPRQLEDYYRKWFKAIGASGAYRNICRIRITNIVLSDFSRTTVYKEFVWCSNITPASGKSLWSLVVRQSRRTSLNVEEIVRLERRSMRGET